MRFVLFVFQPRPCRRDVVTVSMLWQLHAIDDQDTYTADIMTGSRSVKTRVSFILPSVHPSPFSTHISVHAHLSGILSIKSTCPTYVYPIPCSNYIRTPFASILLPSFFPGPVGQHTWRSTGISRILKTLVALDICTHSFRFLQYRGFIASGSLWSLPACR